jgi:hypothetical protein
LYWPAAARRHWRRFEIAPQQASTRLANANMFKDVAGLQNSRRLNLDIRHSLNPAAVLLNWMI